MISHQRIALHGVEARRDEHQLRVKGCDDGPKHQVEGEQILRITVAALRCATQRRSGLELRKAYGAALACMHKQDSFLNTSHLICVRAASGVLTAESPGQEPGDRADLEPRHVEREAAARADAHLLHVASPGVEAVAPVDRNIHYPATTPKPTTSSCSA